MKERFKKLILGMISRKFLVGLPIIVALIWFNKVPGEWGIFALCALFGINSYDKQKRMENGKPV